MIIMIIIIVAVAAVVVRYSYFVMLFFVHFLLNSRFRFSRILSLAYFVILFNKWKHAFFFVVAPVSFMSIYILSNTTFLCWIFEIKNNLTDPVNQRGGQFDWTLNALCFGHHKKEIALHCLQQTVGNPNDY